VEWPESEPEPIKYFFCNMPADTTLPRLVRITKCRWKIEQDYQQLVVLVVLAVFAGQLWHEESRIR